MRAAVVIGVDAVRGGLPRLRAAASGSREFAEWLGRGDSEIRLLSDALCTFVPYVFLEGMTAWYRSRFLFCSFGPLYLLLAVGLAVQHKWTNEGLKGTDTILMFLAGAAFLASIQVFRALRSGFSAASPSRYDVKPLESLDGGVLGSCCRIYRP